MTYWTLRDNAGFTQEEIKQANQFYEQVQDERRIARAAQKAKEEKEQQKREQERLAREREIQQKVDAFLAVRDSTVYQMEPAIPVYETNNNALNECVGNVMTQFDIKKLDLHIVDDLIVHHSGTAQHNISITGFGSDNAELVNALKNAMMQAKLTPMSQTEPASGQNFLVTSRGTFPVDYSCDSRDYDLRVIKKTSEIRLRKGNSQAFNENQNYLSSILPKRGRYDLLLNLDDVCGVRYYDELC